MKTIDNEIFFSISEVAKILGVTNQTIKNWYKWGKVVAEKPEPSTEEKEMVRMLPNAKMNMDNRATRFFNEEAVEALQQFRGKIAYGIMAEHSRTRWGTRGKKQ
jgi:prophage antirepressor-like protein